MGDTSSEAELVAVADFSRHLSALFVSNRDVLAAQGNFDRLKTKTPHVALISQLTGIPKRTVSQYVYAGRHSPIAQVRALVLAVSWIVVGLLVRTRLRPLRRGGDIEGGWAMGIYVCGWTTRARPRTTDQSQSARVLHRRLSCSNRGGGTMSSCDPWSGWACSSALDPRAAGGEASQSRRRRSTCHPIVAR